MEKIKYFQIKRLKTFSKGYESQDIIQIIDISGQIMLDFAKADKKLMALVNVTVSHDMRNPLNALHSQNIQQGFLNQKILDLINSESMTLE